MILFSQVFLGIIRWKRFLILKEITISINRCGKIFWTGLLFNQVLPSSVGGDAIRTFLLMKSGFKIGVSSISILLDRMFGLIGLLILLLIFIPISKYFIPDIISILQIYFLIILMTIFISVIFFLDIFVKRLSKYKFFQLISTLAKDGRYVLRNTQLAITLIILSISIHVLTVLSIGFIALSLNIIVPWSFLFIIVPIVILLVFIPISISGWGLREGIMVFGLSFVGISGAEALTLSLTYGFFLLITSLPGIVFLITNK